MDHVLVTGGAGYIGSHAVKLFLSQGYKVTILDNFSKGFRGAVEALKDFGGLEVIEVDLRDKRAVLEVFEKNKFDGVVHFAAFCSVDESMKNPGMYFENNTVGTLNLLEALAKHKVSKFIFSSTCAVYGETKYLPVDEEHPINPTNPYGESKLLSEKIIAWYKKTHGINYVVLRYFNVCGASSDGVVGDSKKPSVHLIQNIVRASMGLGDTFRCTYSRVDTPDGSPIRDYIDVEDLALAHVMAYVHLKNGGSSDVFNLGSGAGYSVKEMVTRVEEVLDCKIEQKPGEPRKGEYAAIYADNTKIQKTLGWKPQKTLAESIESLKNWYIGHPQGFEK